MRFAPGARRYALVPLVAALPGLALSLPLGVALVAAGVGVLWFFRDPERTPPPGEGVAVAPADGRVSVVREEGDRVRVGVFMGPTDVHVNRAPLSGTVERVDHEPGGHRPAFTKAAEHNERATLDCGSHEVTLIAGAFARRITTYPEAGDDVARGQRVGHIAFGSRADVLLPPDYDPADVAVSPGDRVRAGETAVAEA